MAFILITRWLGFRLAAAPGAAAVFAAGSTACHHRFRVEHSHLYTFQRILLPFLYIFALFYFPIGSRDVS